MLNIFSNDQSTISDLTEDRMPLHSWLSRNNLILKHFHIWKHEFQFMISGYGMCTSNISNYAAVLILLG